MSRSVPSNKTVQSGRVARIAVVAARFNEPIVNRLLDGCLRRLGELGVEPARVEVFHVPGSFELPVACLTAAGETRFDAVIALGCVVRGETPHFDYVAGEAARGIAHASFVTGKPVLFGVLTTNTQRQALDRSGGRHGHAGERAAEGALEMIETLAQIAPTRRAPRRK